MSNVEVTNMIAIKWRRISSTTLYVPYPIVRSRQGMRAHNRILFVVPVVVFLAAIWLMAPVAMGQVNDRAMPWLCNAGQVAAAGGDYRVSGITWHVEGVSRGEGYQLSSEQIPALAGNGCCCSYLPFIRR